MSHPIFIVAKNTYIEMIRDRVLYFVAVFSVLFMAFCFAIGQLSYQEIFRLSVSLGLSGIHLCYIGLTIFLGCSVFYREIERKTIFTLLVRPISRAQYLLGKYLGLTAILFTMLIGFVICFTVIELLLAVPLLPTSYFPFMGFFVESCILLAVTFFFSSFARPFLAITGSVAFFLIGHWVYNLANLITKSKSETFKIAGKAITRGFPDLEMLNWRDHALLKIPVPGPELTYSIAMGCLWAAFFFLGSMLIFRSKDFE